MTAQFRNYLANPLETKAEGDDADPIKALEALGVTISAKFEGFAGELKKIGDRVDTEIAKRNRPGTETKGDEGDVERKAFTAFIRKGTAGLAADEFKSLRVSDDAAGGFLAPADFSAEVDKNLVQFSPIRNAARVGPTSAGSVVIPRRTGRPTGQWVGETEARTETASAYGQLEIPVDEMACYVDCSMRLLEDSAINIEAEVAFDIAEEFGRLEGAAFVSGNGVKKPLGFMSDTTVSSTVSGSAATIADANGQANGLIDLMYALHPFYRSRGVWLANGTTIAALRKLKDGQNNYIWQPSLQADQPATLLGRPVVEAPDMPDVGANNYPVIFGDFASAFRIYDRVGLSIIRDPYTQATVGNVRFHARKRVGARLVRPEAIRKLKVST